jgi:hypothetical protein
MSLMEMAFLGGVIGAFSTFAFVLAWVAHIDSKRPPSHLAGD